MTDRQDRTDALIRRIDYILEADGVEASHRRSHLTAHDLRECKAALATHRTGASDRMAKTLGITREELLHGKRTGASDVVTDAMVESNEIPDWDSPLRTVFDAGLEHGIGIFAKGLGLKHFTPCEGTEDYEGDVMGTFVNIMIEAGYGDEENGWMQPSEARALKAALSTAPADAAVSSVRDDVIEECAQAAEHFDFGPERDERDNARNSIAKIIAKKIRNLPTPAQEQQDAVGSGRSPRQSDATVPSVRDDVIEECAKIADHHEAGKGIHRIDYDEACSDIAKAIRAHKSDAGESAP